MNLAPAAQGGGRETQKPRIKRVPKGTSAYQAAWIVDDDDDVDVDDDDESGSGMGSQDGADGHSSHHREFASA